MVHIKVYLMLHTHVDDNDAGGTGVTATANGVMMTIIMCGLLITLSL